MPTALTAEDVIRRLDLQPHPEGGHFRETFRDTGSANGRAFATAIYFLLAAGERSIWHRVDATEIWHHYHGAPLRLSLSTDGTQVDHRLLGANLLDEEFPQIIVPKDCWQSAESLGAWTLVGCTVSPGFEFSGFEMAPADFTLD